jgi:DUF4097 and DUF4098 domain-containing protein YvlB
VLLVLALGTLALTGVQQLDTTVAVGRGQRLEVHAHDGEVTVQAWSRNAVRVQADLSGRERVEVLTSTTAISVRAQSRGDSRNGLQLRISAPPWMAASLMGVNTGMRVAGVSAPVSAETVDGDVDVNGGQGLVSLRSVQGSVRLRGARGRISVNSVNEDIEVTGSSGEVAAQTVNGDITLQMGDAASVDANTVNGDVAYSGPIRSSGRYALSTHNGDISLTVADGTSASVAVSTFSGEFESEFPVPLQGTRKGKGFSFALGSGSAQVILESFQGTIRLVRPGSEHDPARVGRRDRDQDHDDD